jgi:hypothetical protein
MLLLVPQDDGTARAVVKLKFPRHTRRLKLALYVDKPKKQTSRETCDRAMSQFTFFVSVARVRSRCYPVFGRTLFSGGWVGQHPWRLLVTYR